MTGFNSFPWLRAQWVFGVMEFGMYMVEETVATKDYMFSVKHCLCCGSAICA